MKRIRKGGEKQASKDLNMRRITLGSCDKSLLKGGLGVAAHSWRTAGREEPVCLSPGWGRGRRAQQGFPVGESGSSSVPLGCFLFPVYKGQTKCVSSPGVSGGLGGCLCSLCLTQCVGLSQPCGCQLSLPQPVRGPASGRLCCPLRTRSSLR